MATVLLFTAYDNFALGLRGLSSVLERHGHDATLVFFKRYTMVPAPYLLEAPHNFQLVEYRGEPQVCFGYDASPWTGKEEDLLVDFVRQRRPDVVGLSTRNYIDSELCRITARIKEAHSDAYYVAGGYGPTFTPETYLGVFDCVVKGEGEGALLDICAALDAGRRDSVRGLANVSFLQDGKIVSNPMRPLVQDLDNLPFPAAGGDKIFFVENDSIVQGENTHAEYNLLVGRGCLNRCSFCGSAEWRRLYTSEGHRVIPYRSRSLARALEEVGYARDNGFTSVFIADSFLALPVEEQKTLFLEIERNRLSMELVHFHPQTAVRHPDLIETAYACGMKRTVVGVQHGDEAFSRDVYNRLNDNATLLEFARLLSRFPDLVIEYHFLTGNPLETPETFERHLAFLNALRKDARVRIGDVLFHRLKLFPHNLLTGRIESMALKQDIDRIVYEVYMSLLRLELEDEAFESVYRDPYYRKRPYFLMQKVHRLKYRDLEKAVSRDETDRLEARLAFHESGQSVFSLPRAGLGGVVHTNQLERIDFTSQRHLVATSSGDDPWFVLPPLDFNGGSRHIARIVLETDVEDVNFCLFYVLRNESEWNFDESKCLRIPVTNRPAEIYLPLENIGPHIRLDPGDKPGTYTIRDLEIRTVG